MCKPGCSRSGTLKARHQFRGSRREASQEHRPPSACLPGTRSRRFSGKGYLPKVCASPRPHRHGHRQQQGGSPAPPAHLPSPPMSPSRRVLPAARISTSKRSNHLRHACVIRLARAQVDKTPVVARRSHCRRRTPLVVLRASDDGPITSLSASTGAVI